MNAVAEDRLIGLCRTLDRLPQAGALWDAAVGDN
jgi:hypothetical protein